MKLSESLLISLIVVFVIIGIYEVMTTGVSGYWAVMIAVGLYFYLRYKRTSEKGKK